MTTLSQVLGEQVLGIATEKVEVVEIADVVDLYTNEVHDLRINKTQQPIENGSSITDNAIIEPQRLRMAGYVSNLVPTAFVSLPASERGKEAWVRIEELAKKREPVSIITTLRLYENFLITGLTANVSERTGSALDFQIDFEEILFANSEFVTLPADVLAGPAANKPGTVEGGIKQSPEVDEGPRQGFVTRILRGAN